MADYDTAHLVLRNGAVHDDGEDEQNPREVRGLEYKQPQEAQHGVWVLPTPDVDKRTAKRRAEEGHGEEGRYAEQQRRGERQQP